MVKRCAEHGEFRTPVWHDQDSFTNWTKQEVSIGVDEKLPCPSGCGLCAEHLRTTCCTLLPVTNQCNLRCQYCFAAKEQEGEPSLNEIELQIKELTVYKKTLLQLSGGEPTCREDLPEIIQAAINAGCKYVQLNTNGIRLGVEADYAKKLRKAGLSFVFMQFDSLKDEVYSKLRGRPLLEIKKKAIENCKVANLGVILVPMLVPGVNTDQVGELISFAVSKSPAVRGIHFQPVSYFHMGYLVTPEMRYTLDELMKDIEKQTNGLITKNDLLPSHCDHARCGFHADFIVLPDGLMRLNKQQDCCGNIAESNKSKCVVDPAEKNREFVGRRWRRSTFVEAPDEIKTMDSFLTRIKTNGFTITAMAFMDAGNLDIERLRKCSLHVYDHGNFVPFCAYYLNR